MYWLDLVTTIWTVSYTMVMRKNFFVNVAILIVVTFICPISEKPGFGFAYMLSKLIKAQHAFPGYLPQQILASSLPSAKLFPMSVSQIKAELARLPVTQQDELASYLSQLKRLRDPKQRREITRRNSSRRAGDWISLKQLKAHWAK